VPKIQRGAVIKADMAASISTDGPTVAQPAEPGPAAEAPARASAFQVAPHAQRGCRGALDRRSWFAAAGARRSQHR
jgi:hypothetical protein